MLGKRKLYGWQTEGKRMKKVSGWGSLLCKPTSSAMCVAKNRLKYKSLAHHTLYTIPK